MALLLSHSSHFNYCFICIFFLSGLWSLFLIQAFHFKSFTAVEHWNREFDDRTLSSGHQIDAYNALLVKQKNCNLSRQTKSPSISTEAFCLMRGFDDPMTVLLWEINLSLSRGGFN